MYSNGEIVRRAAGALTLFAYIISSCMASCPPINELQDSGEILAPWYVVAVTTKDPEHSEKCVRLRLRSVNEHHEIFQRMTYNSTIEGKSVIYEGDFILGGDSTVQLGTPYRENRSQMSIQFRVIDVEEEKHAAIMFCDIEGSEEIEGPLRDRSDFGMILAPTTAMPEKEDELMQKLHKYFESEEFVKINHDDC